MRRESMQVQAEKGPGTRWPFQRLHLNRTTVCLQHIPRMRDRTLHGPHFGNNARDSKCGAAKLIDIVFLAQASSSWNKV